MQGILRRCLRTVAMVLVMSLVWVSSASAAGATPKPAPSVSAEEAAMALTAGSFAHITPNGFTFDQQGAMKAGLSKDFVSKMASTYDSINKMENAKHFNWDQLLAENATHQHITTGMVTPDPKVAPSADPKVAPSADPKVAPSADHKRLITPDFTVGRGRGWQGPYIQLSFSEYETRLIIDIVNGLAYGGAIYVAASLLAAAIPTLGVTLPFALIVAFAGAIIAFGGWYLGFIDDLGHNTGIYYRYYYWTAGTVIWHN